MKFQDLSAILKNKRLETTISQEELAQKFKIPLRSIIAIEEGQLHELPHETYIRTFVKEYAKNVGLDLDEVRAMLDTVEEFETKTPPPKSMEAIHAESEPKGAKSKGVRLAVPLLLLALIGTTAYFYYSNGKLNLESIFSISWFSSDSSEESSEAPKDTSIKQKDDTKQKKENSELANKQQNNTQVNTDETAHQMITAETAPSETATDQALMAQNTNTTPSSDTENKNTTANSNADTTTNQTNATKNQEAEAIRAFDTFIAQTPEASLVDWTDFDKNGNLSKQAIIYVKQDCWMQVIIDGKDGHFTLRAGNQRKFDFNKSLQFKIGNASAVTLFHGYNLVNVGDSSVLRVVTLKAS